jgi:uncharacterized protein YndB with AHSA1/START domain
MKEQVRLNVFYSHPPEKVWQALTDRQILNIWMMSNNFEPLLGHKFKFESNSLSGIKTIIYCEVVELEEPKRLAYTWQDEMTSEPSLVIWTLNSVEGGTQVKLSHQQIGYASTVISGIDTNLKQINTRPSLFLYQQPTNYFNEPISHTSSVQIAAREELNTLLNRQNSLDQWNYRLNYQLPQALRNHIKSN